MNLLDRYLARAIVAATALVLFMLLAIDTVFAFLSELDDVGEGSYELVNALWYIALTLPRRAYALFPTAVLLGSLVGLGALASNSELIVMRAAGISNRRIVRAALLTGLLLSIGVFAFGEWVASPSEQLAQQLRTDRISGRISVQGRNGLWIRNDQRYINIRRLLPGKHLQEVAIYDFSDASRMTATRARSGRFRDDAWVLYDVERTRVTEQGVVTERRAEERWARLVDPALFDVLLVRPDSLPVTDLKSYISHLQDNDLDASRYELAYWRKWVAPLTTTIMLLIALPFVFADHRSGGAGQRLLIGSLIGIVYFLIDRLFAQAGLIYAEASPLVSAFLPPLAFGVLAVVLLRRVV